MTVKQHFDQKAAVAADNIPKLLAQEQEYLLYPYLPKCLYFIPKQTLNCVKWNYQELPCHHFRTWFLLFGQQHIWFVQENKINLCSTDHS